MNKWLENINNFISSNRKSIITILFFILIFSFDNTFAETPAATDKNSWYIPLVLMSALAGFSGSIIGFFINPEWTNGSIFGLTDQLKNLWVLTSNIVYFIFAFMLILMAFMNIIGHGKNEYEMKTALPKFIVGILIVPFSWFIVQFVVSITSILTVSVLSLPYDLYKSSIDNMSMKVETNCTLNVDAASNSGTLTNLDSTNEDTRSGRINSIWNCTGEKKISEMFQGNSIFSIMSIYAYGILKINTMDTLKGSQLSSLKSLTDVFLKLGFDVIFLISFLLLSLAMAMALFVRGVYLWLFMILSPTFGLFYFLGDKKGGDFAKKYSFTQFLSLALVPVYVSAALSFGLLFVLIAQNGIMSSSTTGNGKFSAGGDTIEISPGDKFTITGLPGSQKTEGADGKSLLGTMGSLFLIFVSIAILWMAVMAALRSSDITKEIVKPIAEFGGNVGKLITEAPKYAPILPGGLSMEGLHSASSSVKQSWESMGTTKGQEIGTAFADKLGLKTDEYIKHLEKLKTDSDFQTKIKSKNASSIVREMPKLFEGLDLSKDSHKSKLAADLKTYLGYDIDASKIINTSHLASAIDTEMKKNGNTNLNLTKDAIQGIIDNGVKGIGGKAAETSNLPKGISKDDKGINVTIHNKNEVLKLDGHGKITDDRDIDKLVKGFESTKSDYSPKALKTILEDTLGIKDNAQIKEIFKKLRVDLPETK